MRTVHAVDSVLLNRIKSEFLEMPGLRLTHRQAQRLWGIDHEACTVILNALVDMQFLFRTRDGAFMRVERAAPAKADLRSAEQPPAVA